MTKKIYLVVMAAGSGTRMGGELPKQFLKLGGRAILQLTIERLLEACPGARIITVLPESYIEYWKQYCIEANFFVPQILVPGGITRFHSVKNALAKVPDGAVVGIHDGVRPLVSAGLVSEMVRRMESERALIPVLPTVDTLKLLDRDVDGCLHTAEGTAPDRTRVFGAQTPQFFLSEDLKEAYCQAYDTSFTDDASVAESKGIPLSFIGGERYNIKITTPQDLLMAEALQSITQA